MSGVDWVRGDEVLSVSARPVAEGRYSVRVGDEVAEVEATVLPDGRLRCTIGGETFDADWAPRQRAVQVRLRGRTWTLQRASGRRGAAAAGGGVIEAPMAGTVLQVLVETGAEVEAGQPLVVLSAMKMEHKLTAGRAGVVADLNAHEGDAVDQGTVLARIE